MATITYKPLGGGLYAVANRESYEAACFHVYGKGYKPEFDLPTLKEGTVYPCIIQFDGGPSLGDGCLAWSIPLDKYRQRLQDQLDAVKDF